MTQRTDGFNGGIQAGTTASSEESKSLDSRLLEAAKKMNLQQLAISTLWSKGLNAGDLSKRLGVKEGHITGLEPDGGIWVKSDDKGQLVLAAEAKKQGAKGNAIERWYKNWAILSRLEVGVYLTVCTGAGFFNGNRAQKTLETALALESGGPERIRDGHIWNHPDGRLWLYRFQEVPSVEDLRNLLEMAMKHAAKGFL